MNEIYIEKDNHIKLLDPMKRVVAIFIPDERDAEYTSSLCGEIYEVISWDMDGTPNEFDFHSHFSIKWDGSSHFWFYGNEYTKEKGMEPQLEAYYHICGASSFLQHMRLMVFAYELMIRKLGENKVFDNELKDYEHLKTLGLLKDYEIVSH
ncbi:hypothetical protein SMD22_01260 (plasmid) [Brevibacillus halotolerans]|nr:hypothetical protein SMD22_01260 [Brevibacillus halotolerans]